MVNPVVVLRGNHHDFPHTRRFDLYHEDVSGLQPLPSNMADMILGSGIDRLLDQLTHIDTNGDSRYQPPNNNPPSVPSKASIDSLPTVEIQENHLTTESHCAVCMEAFEVGNIARELPCRHIYHSDCILPWLSLRNTCPVCRQELPPDRQHDGNDNGNNGNYGDSHVYWNNGDHDGGDGNVGLSIWRLPGGGFAVGRLGGGRRSEIHDDDDHEIIPVVYTEMDGGSVGNGGEPRRVTWSTTMEGRRRESDVGGGGGGGRLRKMFRNIFGCFNRGHGIRFSASLSTSSSSSSPDPRFLRNSVGSSSSRSRTMVSNSTLRSRRTWSLDANGGTRPW